jgi:gluconolactonase
MTNFDRRQILAAGAAIAAVPVIGRAQAPAAPAGAPPPGAPAGPPRTPPPPYDPNAPIGAPIGKVEKLDPELDKLIDENAIVTRVSNVEGNAEGPCWVPDDGGYLLYADPPGNKMWKWTEKTGAVPFLDPSGWQGDDPNHIFREAGINGSHYRDGHIICADSGDRQVLRINLKTKKREILASEFEGKKFNSPNDIAITKKGVIFFTDPPYGLNGTLKSPERQMDYQGVFRIGLDGKVSLVDRDGGMPNGIGISPDGKILYTSDTGGAPRQMYDLDANDMTSNKRLFGEGDKGGDGFKVAETGHLFASGRGGLVIYTPAGKIIGRIAGSPGMGISNCYFANGTGYLYLSMGHSTGRIKVKVKGVA